MRAKPSHKRRSKLAPPKAQAEPAKPKTSSRTLETVVGADVYRTWVGMLKTLVPDGRTHRLAPLVAAMLQYALVMAEDKPDADEANSVVQSLLDSTEVSDPSEVKAWLDDVVTRLFKDAQVAYGRTSARGYHYSIIDDAYAEYLHWFDMPWE